MEIIEIFGYLGALAIGIVLGLIGGGGSILTVPIFVYALGIDPVIATAYSLFVVGFTSLVGTFTNAFNKLIDYKVGITFAIPTLIAVYLTRKWLVPAIPDPIVDLDIITVTKSAGIMLFFSIVMILASYSMIKKRKQSNVNQKKKLNLFLIVIEGGIVVVITGIIGAGGGFLIIPALVILTGLPMKRAVATSLMIISVKSLIGFLGEIDLNTFIRKLLFEGDIVIRSNHFNIDWIFLCSFTLISILGIFIGIFLNKFIEGPKLKRAFGWFILIMGVYIICKELIL